MKTARRETNRYGGHAKDRARSTVVAACDFAEEQSKAYKNVDDVVDTVHDADLPRKVARMRPIGVMKG